MASPDVMLGTWKLVKQDNFDEYLFSVGGGHITRSMADPDTWSFIVEKLEDDVYKMTIRTTVKSAEMVFRFDGREIEEVTGDGRKCRTLLGWDDGLMTVKRVGLDGCKGGMITREFKGDDLEVFLQVDDVVAKRLYKRETKAAINTNPSANVKRRSAAANGN